MNKKLSPLEAESKPPLYFVNAYVDLFFIGGASLLLFALLRLFHSGERTVGIYTTAAWLSWVCNWPHFSATNYRLYQSKENIRQYPVTAWVVPVLILAAVLGSFASPEILAPYFAKLFTIWSPYHFSGQTLGITLIYARRSGFWVGTLERKALSFFIYGTFFTQSLMAETGLTPNTYYGIKYPSLGLPVWVASASQVVMYAAGAVTLFFIARWCIQKKKWVPLVLVTPAVSQYVWFVWGPRWLAFQEFVPFFHSMQYLLIAWSMQLKERAEITKVIPTSKYVWSETARWGLINFVGGSLLFYFIPKMVTSVSRMQLDFVTGIFIAGVQIHHFFVDGVIWKLKNKTVVSPLMMNLFELITPSKTVQAAKANL